MVLIQRRRSSKRWPMFVLSLILIGLVLRQCIYSAVPNSGPATKTMVILLEQPQPSWTFTPPKELPPAKLRDDSSTTKTPKSSDYFSETPIGTWNHLPLYRHNGNPQDLQSTASCLFQRHPPLEEDSWKYTSCRYENLCWDSESHSYVTLRNKVPTAVSIGGINPRWDGDAQKKLRWTPEYRVSKPIAVLDPNIVLIPFHSMAGHNVGHLLWDDLFAIYSLIRAFLGDENHRPLFLLRQSLNDTLYANCDIRRNKRIQCKENFDRFLPYFNVSSATFSSTNRMEITGTTSDTLICASAALVGLGYWTDHGNHDHGWDGPKLPHNLARGTALYEFGQSLISNAKLDTNHHDAKWITFSLESSRDAVRRLDFADQMQALDGIEPVQSFRFRELSVEQQMKVALSTRIFVTACGGGAMTVTFLPKDSVVIVFYDDTGGLEFASLQRNHQPARLDWDLLNNASHLRVHWLPIHRMNDPAYLKLFRALVMHELSFADRIKTS